MEEPVKVEEPVAVAPVVEEPVAEIPAPVAAPVVAEPEPEPVPAVVEEKKEEVVECPAEPEPVKLENGHNGNGAITPEEEEEKEAATEPEVKIQDTNTTTTEEEKEVVVEKEEELVKEATQEQEEVSPRSDLVPLAPQEEDEQESVIPSSSPLLEEVNPEEVIPAPIEEQLLVKDESVEAAPPLPEIPPPSKMIQFAERALSGEDTPQITIAAPVEEAEKVPEEITLDAVNEVVQEINATEDDLPPPPPSPLPEAKQEACDLVEEMDTTTIEEESNEVPKLTESEVMVLVTEKEAEIAAVTEQIAELDLAEDQRQEEEEKMENDKNSSFVVDEESSSPRQEEQIAETIALIDQVNDEAAALSSSTESATVEEDNEQVKENGTLNGGESCGDVVEVVKNGSQEDPKVEEEKTSPKEIESVEELVQEAVTNSSQVTEEAIVAAFGAQKEEDLEAEKVII